MKEEKSFGAQVVEFECTPLDKALTALRDSQLFDEVALYGSTLHAISLDAAAKIPQARTLLSGRGVTVNLIAPIAPSLEDAFIARLRRVDAAI